MKRKRSEVRSGWQIWQRPTRKGLVGPLGQGLPFQLLAGDFITPTPEEPEGSRLEGTHDPWTCVLHTMYWMNDLAIFF